MSVLCMTCHLDGYLTMSSHQSCHTTSHTWGMEVLSNKNNKIHDGGKLEDPPCLMAANTIVPFSDLLFGGLDILHANVWSL